MRWHLLMPEGELGWLLPFQVRAASVVKHRHALWSLSRFDGASTYGIHGDNKGTGHDTVLAQLPAGREPPLSPDTFCEAMERMVNDGRLAFTSNADMMVVVEQYRRGFVGAFEAKGRLAEPYVSAMGAPGNCDEVSLARMRCMCMCM